MAKYPTKEGKVLSGIVRTEMLNKFEANASTVLPFVKCFSASNNPDISSRVEIVKANYALHDGLVEYMHGYGYTSGTTTGSVISPTGGAIAITEDNEFKVQGTFDLNNVGIFMLYSLPMIFDKGEPVKTYIDAFEKSMRRISRWLSFPLTNVTMNGFQDLVYVMAKGYVFFNGMDTEFENIVENLKEALAELYNQNPNGDDMFKKYWDVMASGIVDFLNENYIITLDTGIGFVTDVNGTKATLPSPYVGSSEGNITFGSDPVIPIQISVPGLPIDISLTFQLVLPDIKWPSITVTDLNCFEKEIVLSVSFDTAVDLASLPAVLIEKISAKINFAIRQMHNLCYPTDEIVKKLGQFISGLEDAIVGAVSGMTKAITDEVVNPIVTQIKLVLLKITLDTTWAVIGNIPATTSLYIGLANAGLALENIKIVTSVIPSIKEKVDKLSAIPKLALDVSELLVVISEYVDICDFGSVGDIPIVAIPSIPVVGDLEIIPQSAVDILITSALNSPDIPPLNPALPLPFFLPIDKSFADIIPDIPIPIPKIEIDVSSFGGKANVENIIGTSASPCGKVGRPDCDKLK